MADNNKNNGWKKADKALDVAGFTLHYVLRIIQGVISGGIALWLLWFQFIYQPVPDYFGNVSEAPWWSFIVAIALIFNAYRAVTGKSFIGLG